MGEAKRRLLRGGRVEKTTFVERKETCAKCRFSDKVATGLTCRFNPPQLFMTISPPAAPGMQMQQGFLAATPNVQSTDWCGKWQARDYDG